MLLPGPLAPPATILPSLNITARSYSCTIFTHTQRDRGKVTIIIPIEITVMIVPIHDPPADVAFWLVPAK